MNNESNNINGNAATNPNLNTNVNGNNMASNPGTNIGTGQNVMPDVQNQVLNQVTNSVPDPVSNPVPNQTTAMDNNTIVTPNNLGLDSGNSVIMPTNPPLTESSNQIVGSVNTQPPVNNSVSAQNQNMSGNGVITPAPVVNNSVGNSSLQSQVIETTNPISNPTLSTPAPGTNYTNPQTINPNPMPGFENSGAVGTTPPITLDNSKQPKKPTNKVAFIIIIVGLLFLVGFGTYYILNHPNLFNKKANIKIETKSFELNLGDPLPTEMSNFASVSGTELTNCSKDISTVDTTKAGTYNFTIKCGDNEEKGTITIVDNTELVVATKTVYKSVGDTTIDPSEFAGNNSLDLTFEFANADAVKTDLNTPGTYQIDLNVKNDTGKEANVKGTLVVLEYKIKGQLVCNSNSQNVTNTSISMTVSGKYGIADTEGNIFGNMAIETYTFTFSDETEYQSYVNQFNQNQTITINNIIGNNSNITFDNDNHTIIIVVDLGEEDINTKYNSTNFKDYSSIKNYFQGIGYTCSYQK